MCICNVLGFDYVDFSSLTACGADNHGHGLRSNFSVVLATIPLDLAILLILTHRQSTVNCCEAEILSSSS